VEPHSKRRAQVDHQVKRPHVELLPLDDELIDRLLEVAIADAEPEEVMPPVADGHGWSATRREAFRTFLYERRGGFSGPHREVHFAVLSDGEIVGFARLARRSEPGVLETGTWIAHSKRNIGIGSALIGVLLQRTAIEGATVMVAETTTTNHAALAILRRHGARFEEGPGGSIRARLEVPSKSEAPR
jgi:RimJ/RimL family protein N-acetyltransferase